MSKCILFVFLCHWQVAVFVRRETDGTRWVISATSEFEFREKQIQTYRILLSNMRPGVNPAFFIHRITLYVIWRAQELLIKMSVIFK